MKPNLASKATFFMRYCKMLIRENMYIKEIMHAYLYITHSSSNRHEYLYIIVKCILIKSPNILHILFFIILYYYYNFFEITFIIIIITIIRYIMLIENS